MELMCINSCRRLFVSNQYLRRGLLSRSNAALSTTSTSTTSIDNHAILISPLSPTIASARLFPTRLASFHSNSSVARSQFHSSTTAQTSESDATKTIAPFTSPKVEALFQKILWLDMVEVHLLAELINEKLGITISEAERERMARGGGGGRGRSGSGLGGGDDEAAGAAKAVEEKTIFDIKLTGFDAKNKIKVIKEVRAITNLGLKEAKDLVEGVPATLKKNIKKEEAEELKAKLVEIGAQVEIA